MVAICCQIFSTATALVRVTEDLRSAKVTVQVLLDFSKAFDLINHGLFVHKLDSRYDFHTSAMCMVSSFLRDRSMVVEVDAVKSTARSLSSGVPRGCIPYPLFFSMLINDLCSCIRFSKFHFYAHDLQIYLPGIGKTWMRCLLHSMRIWLRFLDGRLRMGCYLTPPSILHRQQTFAGGFQ
jgi:hypothetical protein